MVTVILLGREASALCLGSMDGDRSRADVAQSRLWLGTGTNCQWHPCNLDLLYLEELEFIQVCIRCHLLSEASSHHQVSAGYLLTSSLLTRFEIFFYSSYLYLIYF